MPRGNAKTRPKKVRRAIKPSRHESIERQKTTLVLMLSVLMMAGLVGWAVCMDAGEWNGWLGSLRSEQAPDDSDADGESADSQTQFQGSGHATLGEFSVDRRENDDTMLTVNFQLSGKTICKDGKSFKEFTDQKYPDFRRHVEGAIRDCEFAALSDERSLGRKVVARVNRLLGHHFLETVEFDELTIYEQIGSYEPEIWKPTKQTEQ